MKRHAQYYLNDRPCVERDEHHYEREEETSYKQQPVQKNRMHLESNDTHGSNQYRSEKWGKVVAILSAIWTLSDDQGRKHVDRGNDEHLSILSRVFRIFGLDELTDLKFAE